MLDVGVFLRQHASLQRAFFHSVTELVGGRMINMLRSGRQRRQLYPFDIAREALRQLG
jgi:hypothetical protein